MAEAVVHVADFIESGNRCPCCYGKVEIVGITDKSIHFACPRCNWDELFLAIYGEDPSNVPWAYEEVPAVHPL